ncbi:hypothetical protein [Halobaculum magnesiiphilum]|uniref:Uncharacterized protein n=1 Tax=Halobaculum magnesiiphilum TaxID=1017351 RepID=A0A8T8WH77_9EURY|nr:hypothetical protein [Halobaculum magnesiiphilum]QZP39198.1 hypothetical protein K6T50_16180 [Halobaculum magnesiiphilum]
MGISRQFTSAEVAQTDDDWLQEHREEIEREANADHGAAWVFKRMIQSLNAGRDE